MEKHGLPSTDALGLKESLPLYVVADIATSFTVLVGIFFPSVTGEPSCPPTLPAPTPKGAPEGVSLFLEASWLAPTALGTSEMRRNPSQWGPFWPLLPLPLSVSFPRPGTVAGGCAGRRHFLMFKLPPGMCRHTTHACTYTSTLTHMHTFKGFVCTRHETSAAGVLRLGEGVPGALCGE